MGTNLFSRHNFLWKKVIFNILKAQGGTFYYCHDLLTGNDSFYDTDNVEGLEMKFLAHFTEGKQQLTTF